MGIIIILTFSEGRNGSTEKLSNLTKVTQLDVGRARVQTQPVILATLQHQLSMDGFPEEVTFEQTPEGGEVASHADICGKGALGRGNSVYEGSNVGASTLCGRPAPISEGTYVLPSLPGVPFPLPVLDGPFISQSSSSGISQEELIRPLVVQCTE